MNETGLILGKWFSGHKVCTDTGQRVQVFVILQSVCLHVGIRRSNVKFLEGVSPWAKHGDKTCMLSHHFSDSIGN